VNSDDESVATIHTDGYPYLDPLDRTLKCFRREAQTDGTYAWKIRASTYIFDVTDNGNETTIESEFVAYSPLQRLVSRKCRDAGGSDALVVATGDAAQLLKTQIDRTNSVKGDTGIDTSGTWDPCPSQTVRWERKMMAEAATDLTSAFNGFDLIETPVDVQTGKLAMLGATPRRGGQRIGIKLGYQAAPHNVKTFKGENHGTALANDLEGFGQTAQESDTIVSTQSDAASIGRYGTYEDIYTSPDAADQATLDQQTINQLAQRRGIVPVVQLGLQEGAARPPWVDEYGNQSWDIGDTIASLAVGKRVRGGMPYNGVAFRIQGFDLDIDEEGNETVSNLVVAPAGL